MATFNLSQECVNVWFIQNHTSDGIIGSIIHLYANDRQYDIEQQKRVAL